MASVPRSVREPELCHAWCTTSTVNLLNAVSLQAGFAGSYWPRPAPRTGTRPFVSKRESDTPSPLSPYAAAKLASEAYCQAFPQSYEIETVDACDTSTSLVPGKTRKVSTAR